MPDYMSQIVLVLVGGLSSGAMLHGVAAIIRERYRGKALLIRAKRGDPE
jgi:hypothetical protein